MRRSREQKEAHRPRKKSLPDGGRVLRTFREDPKLEGEAADPRRAPFFVRCVGGDLPGAVHDVAHALGTPGRDRGRREATEVPRRATLVFDGRCGVCTWFVRVMQQLDRKRRITVVPYQKPGVPTSVGLTAEACKEAAWAVTPEGHHHRGAEAVNLALAVALGTRFPHAFYRLPLVKRVQDHAYDWVAANRHRLPGDEPHCSRHPGECA